jgi:phosphoglycolate phosphatase
MKRARYRAIIFDLDGTLLDTLEDLGNSVNEMLSLRGYAEHSLSKYRDFVGSGARQLIVSALPSERLGEVDDALSEFLQIYARHWNRCSCLYPGVQAMLQSLFPRVKDASLKIGLYSNKPHQFTKQCVAEYFPEVPFCLVEGQVRGRPAKPDPRGTAQILAMLGVQPEQALYVGDTNIDLLTAKNAGMDFAGVAWGFRPQELHQEEIYLKRPEELSQYIE